MCSFLRSCGPPDTGCRRFTCPVPSTVACATHLTRCHPPNSASEPNVQFLTVVRAARHRVQAVHLPGAIHCCRCDPPHTVPPTQFGQRAECAVSYGRAGRPTPGAGGSPARCHPLLPVPPTSHGATHPIRPAHCCRCHPPHTVPSTVAGATHLTRCHPPNSASEPNVQFLTVGRAARHRVQAVRLPGATHRCRCHPPFAVPPTVAGATHRCRCHPPFAVPPTVSGAIHCCRCHPPHTVPPPQFGQRSECAVSYGRAGRPTPGAGGSPARCHPPLPVPPTEFGQRAECDPLLPVPPTSHGATHPFRPASRMCSFLRSGGPPDTGCRRFACRCHPLLSVPESCHGAWHLAWPTIRIYEF
jgi:hypothetical protein